MPEKSVCVALYVGDPHLEDGSPRGVSTCADGKSDMQTVIQVHLCFCHPSQ